MNTKYVIEEKTLTNIADSIRNLHGTSDPIPVEDFAGLIVGVEPPIEEYMKISDLIDLSRPIDEKNYTTKEIERCIELYNFYLEMEGLNNGE